MLWVKEQEILRLGKTFSYHCFSVIYQLLPVIIIAYKFITSTLTVEFFSTLQTNILIIDLKNILP